MYAVQHFFRQIIEVFLKFEVVMNLIFKNEKKTNSMISNHYPSLADFLREHQGERHVAILQDFPDPDAISSAFAHKLISAEFNIDVDILYRGVISHQQNVALVKLLSINLTAYDASMDLTTYDGAVFIDNQGTTAKDLVSRLEAAGVKILMVIDHHEIQHLLNPEFSDIRKVGATATMYAHYLEDGLLEIDPSNQQHTLAATALMHGIITDTGSFIRAKNDDFQAAKFLSRFVDTQLLQEIMSQSRSKSALEVIQKAISSRTTIENFSISGVGYIRAEDRDTIPQAADFLLSEENVHTALVYGIVISENQEEDLIASLRTSKLTLDTDQFIKEVFGKNESGDYFGGGKEYAGGFAVPVGFLAGSFNEEYKNLKWQLFSKQVRHLILSKLGIEAAPIES